MPKPISALSLEALSEDDKASRSPFSEAGLEALQALNMGDFVSQALLSGEFAERLQQRAQSEPQRLKKQLVELVELYSLHNVLGLSASSGSPSEVSQTQVLEALYGSLVHSLAQMSQAEACFLFKRGEGEEALTLIASTQNEVPLRSTPWPSGLSRSTNPGCTHASEAQAQQFQQTLGLAPSWSTWLYSPVYLEGNLAGYLVLASTTPDLASEAAQTFTHETATLLGYAEALQALTQKAAAATQQELTPVHRLLSLRADLTEAIATLNFQQQQCLLSLADLVDARNAYSQGQSQAVAHLAQRLGEALKLNDKFLELLYYAGLLGGVGKFASKPQLLNAQRALTPAELTELRQHTSCGVELLMQIQVLGEMAPYVQYQNERWDGSGQPEGLVGEQIPLGSRILAVANAFVAMRQQRPYRGEALSPAEALETLKAEAGTLWDPLVVDTLVKLAATKPLGS